MMPLGYDIHNILFFFGAGASAPFGIPTMKQFVDDFERFLSDNSSREEISFYKKVKDTLNSQLNRDIDLEDVFTVIDGYINFNFEKLGVLALYIFSELSKPRSKSPDYIEKDSKICESLRDKYRKFVKDKCLIPDQSFGKISNVYKDFFNRLFLESTSPRSYVDYQKGGYCYSTNWTIFTTNYDTCLEYYFREVAGVSC